MAKLRGNRGLKSKRQRQTKKVRRKMKNWKDLLPQSKKVRRGLLLLFYLSTLFGLLLVNQARIAQKGFDNARVENRIRRLSIQNAQKREDLLKRDDIARVREEAEHLGMNLPLEGQIKKVHVARQDYMRFSAKEDQQALQDFDLQRALNNVARYRSAVAPPVHPIVLPFGREQLNDAKPPLSSETMNRAEAIDLPEPNAEHIPSTTTTDNGEENTDGAKPSDE